MSTEALRSLTVRDDLRPGHLGRVVFLWTIHPLAAAARLYAAAGFRRTEARPPAPLWGAILSEERYDLTLSRGPARPSRRVLRPATGVSALTTGLPSRRVVPRGARVPGLPGRRDFHALSRPLSPGRLPVERRGAPGLAAALPLHGPHARDLGARRRRRRAADVHPTAVSRGRGRERGV
jgi:hypothetical protein